MKKEIVSPLWLLTQNPTLNNLITKLQNYKELLTESTQEVFVIFSESEIAAARQNFSEMILMGEKRLHQLCELLCDSFFEDYQIESNVIGEIVSTGERFNLTQSISREQLYSTTDIDLGNRQINKIRFLDNKYWSEAFLVSNTVNYQPAQSNDLNIHRIISRIKAEEEIWNKVVDEIFDLDSLIKRDKKLRHLGRYIKDIFGIKILVDEDDDTAIVQRALQNLKFSPVQLTKIGLNANQSNNKLKLLEFKDYLSSGNAKISGWKAYKSVFIWNGKMFEIQIQTLSNFLHEREWLTNQSHQGFKIKRENIRDVVAGQMPLFRFYRELLKWLFSDIQQQPPVYPGVILKIID
jgi:hypothetical protein